MKQKRSHMEPEGALKDEKGREKFQVVKKLPKGYNTGDDIGVKGWAPKRDPNAPRGWLCGV